MKTQDVTLPAPSIVPTLGFVVIRTNPNSKRSQVIAVGPYQTRSLALGAIRRFLRENHDVSMEQFKIVQLRLPNSRTKS